MNEKKRYIYTGFYTRRVAQGYKVCLERSTPIPYRRQNVNVQSRK